MFEHLADELNNSGLDMRKTLKPSVDIPWTKELIKEHLWRPVQVAMLDKKSTTELESQEIDKVFRVLCRHLGIKFGLSIAFPSIETLINNQTDYGM